tara:strand:- start:1188 stop:1826 length:639 start_codon:yes stop_codon:yes gene_type:complete
MLLVYDDENVLHITNDNGLRWNYQKTQKPQFSFDYDALFYCPFDDETEYVLNGKKEPLSEEHISEIEEYIKLCDPPATVTMQKQIIEDLEDEVENRLSKLQRSIDEFGFRNTAQLVIASREMSNDPRRQIGRRVLDWMDFINGVYYRLKEEINQTLEIDLKDYESYANQLPSIPSQDTFYETSWADDRFDKSSDTLDINGGQEDIGEDKRSV